MRSWIMETTSLAGLAHSPFIGVCVAFGDHMPGWGHSRGLDHPSRPWARKRPMSHQTWTFLMSWSPHAQAIARIQAQAQVYRHHHHHHHHHHHRHHHPVPVRMDDGRLLNPFLVRRIWGFGRSVFGLSVPFFRKKEKCLTYSILRVTLLVMLAMVYTIVDHSL